MTLSGPGINGRGRLRNDSWERCSGAAVVMGESRTGLRTQQQPTLCGRRRELVQSGGGGGGILSVVCAVAANLSQPPSNEADSPCGRGQTRCWSTAGEAKMGFSVCFVVGTSILGRPCTSKYALRCGIRGGAVVVAVAAAKHKRRYIATALSGDRSVSTSLHPPSRRLRRPIFG